PVIQTFGRLWEEIQDLPRHLGQHSGGMVMCHGRLDKVGPLENASMPDRVVVQWDKDDCADMKIVKVDLLGLGMMSVLQDALELVNKHTVGAPAARAEGESSSPEARGSGGGAPRPVKMMSVLQDALELVNRNRDSRLTVRGSQSVEENTTSRESRIANRDIAALDLAHLPANDPDVYRMLQEA